MVMTNDRCIAQCSPTGKRYAATFGNDCFCGDFVDDVNEVKVAEEQCTFLCGGNQRQRCGGRFNAGILKRQLPGVIAADVRFSIYVRAGAASGVVSGASVTGGSPVTTGIVVPTNAPQCFGDDCYKTINCYGQYCTFNFGCSGPDCQRRVVSVDGVWRPEACNGYDCGRKVVCNSGKCAFATPGMVEYNQKVTCYGNYCQVEKCSGDSCNQKCMCQDGSCLFQACPASEALNKYEYSNGQYTLVKSCDGSCPTPAPPCSACQVVVQQPACASVVCNSGTCTTVITTPPPITKVPYQTTPPAIQPPVATGPVAPGQPPVVTGQPPAMTGQAPVVTGQPPVQPPVVPGQPPAVTGVAPGVTGQPPVISGKPPVSVVTAGASSFVATFGAIAFSAFAAALLL
ncbi:hypothetical protein LZ30DRAFT_715644 [Colletotrichum cereale]|nr:hypothetical protein LZ30DRAFT_715644 [Colletotrichum cereale]